MLTKNEINQIAETMATETNGKRFSEILNIWEEVVLVSATKEDWHKIVFAFTKKWKEKSLIVKNILQNLGCQTENN